MCNECIQESAELLGRLNGYGRGKPSPASSGLNHREGFTTGEMTMLNTKHYGEENNLLTELTPEEVDEIMEADA